MKNAKINQSIVALGLLYQFIREAETNGRPLVLVGPDVSRVRVAVHELRREIARTFDVGLDNEGVPQPNERRDLVDTVEYVCEPF